ncbi:MAG: tryptophan synthase subunit alpha [Nonlabens sp.]
MKNKLTALFTKKPKGLLNIFFTAGYPNLDDTVTILQSLAETQVDLVEIGIPFSDPLADGPTIQESSKIALENGMSIEKLMMQLESFKSKNPDSTLPILLMGYFNPVMQYGLEKFCEHCKKAGVDGLIVPDLPLDIYLSEYKTTFEKYDISNVFLVTPQTSEKRIRQIDEETNSFIYAVSSASTTGSKSNFSDAGTYLSKLKNMELNSPILTGFNIKTQANFDQACEYVNGAIIGSEFIRQIDGDAETSLNVKIKKYIESIKC